MIKLHLSAIDFGLEVALGGTHKPKNTFQERFCLLPEKAQILEDNSHFKLVFFRLESIGSD